MHNIYHIKIGTFFNLREKDRKREREREKEREREREREKEREGEEYILRSIE